MKRQQKTAQLEQLSPICGRVKVQRTFETIMSVYESQALDPHVNRERFREKWF